MTLSGGQRQRTSLARGLIKEAPILMLDDSVSAVDTVTESTIIRNLEDPRGQDDDPDRPSDQRAHACGPDHVMDEGRIVERGTHRASCFA